MEVGIEHLALAQHRAFARLRLFHLHHHLAFGEDRRGAGLDDAAGGFIIGVAGADAIARAAFHPHLMAVRGEFVNALGRQADAVFVVLDFADGANTHGEFLCQLY